MGARGVTNAPGAARAQQRWYLRPRTAFPVLAAIVIVVAVITPEATQGRSGDARLSTYSSSSLGARGLSELADRLGWSTRASTAPDPAPPDTGAILAILDPPQPLTATETHGVLEYVRAGGALLYVLGGGAMSDSLHLRPGAAGILTASDDTGSRTCPPGYGGVIPMWPDREVHLYSLMPTAPLPDGIVRLASVEVSTGLRGRSTLQTVVGFPLGNGRVVVVADPDILRNDVLRVCQFGTDVIAVRILEYLRGSGQHQRRTLVFDEYHQGHGLHPGTTRAVTTYLTQTRTGRALAQLTAAGLILLLAVGARPVPPLQDTPVQRRSPLEHVQALASAYARVGATRTAMQRLLHGVRRRTEHNVGRTIAGQSDTEFLSAAGRAHPALASDVADITRALQQSVSRREFETIAGGAIRRLESSFSGSTK